LEKLNKPFSNYLNSYRITVNKRNLVNLGLVLLGWTGFALFFASRTYMERSYNGRSLSWQTDLSIWLLCGYSWAILTPPLLFLARRFPFKINDLARWLAIHIPASVLFSLVQLAIYSGFRLLLGFPSSDFFGRYQSLVVEELHSNILVYFSVLGIKHAVDYVLKPSAKTHEQVVNGTPDNAGETGEPAAAESTRLARRFSIKENGRIELINTDEIDWIDSDGNYVRLHLNGKKYLLRETMKAMEHKLDPAEFVRIRRSAIVRIKQIKELHPVFNGEFEIVLRNNTKLVSTRRYKKNLDRLLKN
jgi:uncharacterized protein YlzI (FlbEa/FlbD family)